MKIKSDNKNKINWCKYKPTMDFRSLDDFLKTWIGVLSFFVICCILAIFVWEYNALHTFLIVMFGSTIVFMRKDFLGEKLAMSTFVILITMWLATANMIALEDKKVSTIVKYDKIEYTDSTEKVIIHATEPIKKVIVLDTLSTEQYYTIKGKQDLNVSILYSPSSDFYDYKKGVVSEYRYNYLIKDDGIDWKSRLIEKDEKWF